MKEKENEKKVNQKQLNEVVSLSAKLLKIVYIFLVIVAVYMGIKIGSELGLWNAIFNIFKVLSPLFIGVLIAWLFNPTVSKLQDRGIKRGWGTLLVYFVFIGIIVIMLWIIIPQLTTQITEFSSTIPDIFDSISAWINDFFNKIAGSVDINTFKLELFQKIEEFGKDLASGLPETVFNITKSFFAGAGSFIVGLIIGFYLLVSFNDLEDSLLDLVPLKLQMKYKGLTKQINKSLRKYVQGALIDCSLVALISTIGLWAVGLKAPLLFGVLCGITNIIPYAGPYIGGIPVVIVGLSQSPLIGILALVVIVLIQFVEGNFLQPMIMSKITKLHPVTIMLGLLIFGHFLGIIGMIISTPIISVLKVIINYLDEKYDILNFN